MLWRNRKPSGNIVDRRGMGGGTLGIGGLIVGAIFYSLTSWSNFGSPPLDYALPGNNILSAFMGAYVTNDPDGVPDPIAVK